MEKVIKIGKQEVKLNNNVAWTMEYRDQFGKDILPVIMPFMASMIEGVSTIAADAGELTLANIAEALEGRSMDVLLPMFQAEFVDLVVNVTWAMAKAGKQRLSAVDHGMRRTGGSGCCGNSLYVHSDPNHGQNRYDDYYQYSYGYFCQAAEIIL